MLFLSGRTGVHEYVPVHATAPHVSMFVIVATNGWNSTIMEPRESAAIVQLNAIPHCTFVREDPLANKFSNIQKIFNELAGSRIGGSVMLQTVWRVCVWSGFAKKKHVSCASGSQSCCKQQIHLSARFAKRKHVSCAHCIL